MTNTSKIAILILAAGSASRMGKPKQLLPWKKTTLLGHAIETALHTNARAVYVVLGSQHDTILDEMKQYNVNFAYNENWYDGMGSSIAFGMKHIMKLDNPIDGVLMLLADQPLIDSDYLSRMIQAFNNDENKIVASSYGEGKLGVPAIFGSEYFESLSILKGDSGAKQLIKKHIENVSQLEAESMISDIDTNADYVRLYNANH